MKTVAEVDAELAALDQLEGALLSKNFQPDMAASDIDAQLAMLDEVDAAANQPGFLDNVLSSAGGALAEVGRTVDSYTGAPTRAALGAIAQGKPGEAFGRAVDQFGEDPAMAPTGKEIATVLGASTAPIGTPEQVTPITRGPFGMTQMSPGQAFQYGTQAISPAGVAGAAIDVAADPTNLIPIGAILKLGGKLGAKGAANAGRVALKGSVAALDAALDTNKVSSVAADASRAIDNVMASVKKRFNPSRAEDYAEFVDIAKRMEIDPDILPETVEFGPQSTITKKSKVVAEGPGGEPIQKRYEAAKQEIGDAVDRVTRRIGGGERLSDIEAGNLIVDSYNAGIKDFFAQDLLTHEKIMAKSPGANLTQDAIKMVQSKVKGINNKAAGRLSRGFGEQPAQARQVMRELQTLQRSFDKHGNISYKKAVEAMRNIGEEAFKKGPSAGKTPIDREMLKDLYFTMRDAITETVAGVHGQEAATELAMSNKLISDFLDTKSTLSKIVEGAAAPEEIARRVTMGGNSDRIEALKTILSPEAFTKVKGYLADSVIKRNSEGAIMYRTTLNNLGRREVRSIIESAFQPDEIADITDVLRLGDRSGDFIFNTSGSNTGARFSPKAFLSEIAGGAADEVSLERMKDIARGKVDPKASASPSAQYRPAGRQAPPQRAGVARAIPIMNSQTRQAVKASSVASTNKTNEEIEKRKRAISSQGK